MKDSGGIRNFYVAEKFRIYLLLFQFEKSVGLEKGSSKLMAGTRLESLLRKGEPQVDTKRFGTITALPLLMPENGHGKEKMQNEGIG